MKKFITIALVLVLTMSLIAGCRGRQNEPVDNKSDMTNNSGNNMLPGTDDTIDPTNGANNNGNGSASDTSEPVPSTTNTTTDSTTDNSRNRDRVFPGH